MLGFQVGPVHEIILPLNWWVVELCPQQMGVYTCPEMAYSQYLSNFDTESDFFSKYLESLLSMGSSTTIGCSMLIDFLQFSEGQYNGGLLPDILLLTQGYNHRGTTRLNAMYVEVFKE